MKIYILLVIIVVPLTAVLVVSRLLRPRNSVNRQSNQEKNIIKHCESRCFIEL